MLLSARDLPCRFPLSSTDFLSLIHSFGPQFRLADHLALFLSNVVVEMDSGRLSEIDSRPLCRVRGFLSRPPFFVLEAAVFFSL